MSEFFHSKLIAVEALAPPRLRTTWSTGEVLGISRRMVSYYRTAHKAIPRAIWLACLGWEATRPQDKALPRALPSAREYAAARA